MTVENNLDFDQYEDFTYGKKGYNDRKLTEKIESYINHLNKYNISKRQEQGTLVLINKDMISYLQRNIRL